KTNSNLKHLLTATIIAGVFGVSSSAQAGEGGAAGAAAFSIDAGAVTGVAVAAAVGKQDAFAAAFNVNDTGFNLPAAALANNTAFALGSAGVIQITTAAPGSFANVSGNQDPDLETAQENQFASGPTIQIGTQDADQLVDLVP
ncbi:hypothetical protein, partial [Crocosphaera watsonii]